MRQNEKSINAAVRDELMELIGTIVNGDRKQFHIYTIHRLISLGLLNDFHFHYLECNRPDWIKLQIITPKDRIVKVSIDINSQYGKIEDEESMVVLKELHEENKIKQPFYRQIFKMGH